MDAKQDIADMIPKMAEWWSLAEDWIREWFEANTDRAVSIYLRGGGFDERGWDALGLALRLHGEAGPMVQIVARCPEAEDDEIMAAATNMDLAAWRADMIEDIHDQIEIEGLEDEAEAEAARLDDDEINDWTGRVIVAAKDYGLNRNALRLKLGVAHHSETVADIAHQIGIQAALIYCEGDLEVPLTKAGKAARAAAGVTS